MTQKSVTVSLRVLQEIQTRIAEALFQLGELPPEIKRIRLRVTARGTILTNRRMKNAGVMYPVSRAIDSLEFAAGRLKEELQRVVEE
jgi:hypothetical protein